MLGIIITISVLKGETLNGRQETGESYFHALFMVKNVCPHLVCQLISEVVTSFTSVNLCLSFLKIYSKYCLFAYLVRSTERQMNTNYC